MFTFHCHLEGARTLTLTSDHLTATWSPASAEAALLNIANLWAEGREVDRNVLNEEFQWAVDDNGNRITRAWRKWGPNHMGSVFFQDGSVVEIWDGNISG